MKILSAILTVITLVIATSAQAQKYDLSTITCKQFLAMEQAPVGVIMIWLGGYYVEEDAPPIVDVDKIKKDADKLEAYCKQNPAVMLNTAADEAIGN